MNENMNVNLRTLDSRSLNGNTDKQITFQPNSITNITYVCGYVVYLIGRLGMIS